MLRNNSSAVAAATDGGDSLVLLQQGFNGEIFAQLVSQRAGDGPAAHIGSGYAGSVVWTGSEYLVFWANFPDQYLGYPRLYMTRVSRRGAVLGDPTLLMLVHPLAGPKAVSNGRKILVTAETRDFPDGPKFVGVVIDVNSRSVSQPITIMSNLDYGRHDYSTTGTRDGFAFARFGDETRIFLLNDAGTPLIAGGTRIEGPNTPVNYFRSFYGALVSNGTDLGLLVTSSDSQIVNGHLDLSTKFASLGSRGEIVQGPRKLSFTPDKLGSVLFNGSEYVAAMALTPSSVAAQASGSFGSAQQQTTPLDTSQDRIVLQHISTSGELLRVDAIPAPPLGPYAAQPTPVLVMGQREYLIAIGDSFVRLPLGSSTPTDPVRLTRLLNEQVSLSMARGARGFLAVWSENDGNGTTVRASRIDASGRYLDGLGIVLDTMPYSGPYVTTSVDSDGQTWLAVWSRYDGTTGGCRISADGTMLDPRPLAIPVGYAAVVRWGINSWLLVAGKSSRISTATVTPDGVVRTVNLLDGVGPQLPLSEHSYVGDPFHPALAFDGHQFLLVWPSVETISDGISFTDTYVSIVTERLDLNGEFIPGSRYILPPEKNGVVYTSQIKNASFVSVASNGSQDLVVFRDGGSALSGLLLNRGYLPTTIRIGYNSGGEDLAAETPVTWNGSQFVAARTIAPYYGGQVELNYISPTGIQGSTVTLPRQSTEITSSLVFPPSSPTRQPFPQETDPLGRVAQHDLYNGVGRAEFLFASDIASYDNYTPAIPLILNAIDDASGVTLSWKAQTGILGIMIVVLQSDGTERLVGVASGTGASVHVSDSALRGATFSLRSWNKYYVSSGSPWVQSTMPPKRARAVGK